MADDGVQKAYGSLTRCGATVPERESVMATAMHQDEVTASEITTQKPAEQKSVAARELDKALKAKNDVESLVLAKVVLNEHLERLAKQEPNGVLNYVRCISAQADWAVEQLGYAYDVPLECRSFLCKLVIDGWLRGPDGETRKRCAKALRSWPTLDERWVSKLLRERFESDTGVLGRHVSQILGEFFVEASLSTSSNEIWRTVFKAIARYSSMQDLVLLGRTFCVLQSKGVAPLQDAIKKALAS